MQVAFFMGRSSFHQELCSPAGRTRRRPRRVETRDVLHVPLPNPPCYECNVVLTYEVSGAAFDAVTDPWIEDFTPAAP